MAEGTTHHEGSGGVPCPADCHGCLWVPNLEVIVSACYVHKIS